MRRRNLIGRTISRLRSEQNWSQNDLATRLQLAGVDISRDMIARVELGLTKVSDELIQGLQLAFRVPIARLFPLYVQDKDHEFAKREKSPATRKTNQRRRS